MHPIVRNVLAVIVGFVVGSVVNLGLITVGMSVIPVPDGLDMSNMEGVRAAMKTLPAQNFVFPFVAHALGTFVGAWIAAALATGRRVGVAIAVGVLFLLGGVAMILNCGGPVWFIAADLLLAYIPTAWLGAYLATPQPKPAMA